MIGYSGTGYKGMQLTHDQKTIEGDLFKAFVEAGAVSKANADDPKKSSFVRCARTDKGVHAAGNVISLKLIVEDNDIVSKINEHLNPQIRVWGFERTNNSFSAYQLCDSRIYEYLIPTHSFLPPHPRSYLGRKCHQLAEENSNMEFWQSRQAEVEEYWEKVDLEHIEPILQSYAEDVRAILEKAVHLRQVEEDAPREARGLSSESVLGESMIRQEAVTDATHPEGEAVLQPRDSDRVQEEKVARSLMIEGGVKKVRAAYIKAKRAYRIPERRLERVREVLQQYVGTRNYHNYTVQKSFKDPSAKRVIKSFVVNPEPTLINGTEWLSLKVHGQSFMMHQIRKMVAMAALIVRCGCDPKRIIESFGPDDISIPKAPSLGLLLERPIFDNYNTRAKSQFSKETIDFEKYRTEMDAFKHKQIYERMYSDEEKDNVFGNFFNHVDNFPNETFLFVTAGGITASKLSTTESKNYTTAEEATNAVEVESDDEDGARVVNDENGDEG